MKKYNYFPKLTLVLILVLIFLSGCGGSENLPKIVNLTYNMENNQLIVEATDDTEISGYIIMYTNDEPKLDDVLWQKSNIFNYVEVGTIKVWVRDNDDNLANSEIIVEKETVTSLSKEYEFLQWYLDGTTTKTVDGVAYDLTSLKQQYGDLYRFVEPLSKEEVEYRFRYLAEYFVNQSEKGKTSYAPGGVNTDSVDLANATYPKITGTYEKIYNTDDEKLKLYTRYYTYLVKTGSYYIKAPESLKINDEYEEYNFIEIIDSAIFEDKNWFVRQYQMQIDIMLDYYKQNGEEPKFDITLSGKTN